MNANQAFNLPQELFDAAKDKVLEFREEHKLKYTVVPKVTTSKVPHPTIPNRLLTKSVKTWEDKLTHSYKTYGHGVGLVEFLSYYTLEYGFGDVTQTGEQEWSLTNADGSQRLIVAIADKVYIWKDEQIRTLDVSVPIKTNGVTTIIAKTLSSGEVANLISTQEANVLPYINNKGFVWTGKKIDLSKTIGYLYCTIERDGDTVNTDVIVNGQSFKDIQYGSYAYPSGKTGNSFVVDWVLYNEHVLTGSPKWISEGDMGEAVRHRIASKSDPKATSITVVEGEVAGYDEDTHTLTYDPTKGAVLCFRIESNQAQGHEDTWEVCLDLNSGEVNYSRFAAIKSAQGK